VNRSHDTHSLSMVFQTSCSIHRPARNIVSVVVCLPALAVGWPNRPVRALARRFAGAGGRPPQMRFAAAKPAHFEIIS
jgi:hypothetical protein